MSEQYAKEQLNNEDSFPARRLEDASSLKLLIVSDVEDEYLWNLGRDEVPEVDLILSCGDLDPDYLQYLVTMFNCTLLYVHGNHDTKYDSRPPLGCVCADDKVINFRGLRILGLGGSYKYRDGKYMYTEREMMWRFVRALPGIICNGGVDILLTHAPARGIGDMEDIAHRGFTAFGKIIKWLRPKYHFHGHVHRSYGTAYVSKQTRPNGTVVINGCRKHFLEVVNPKSER